MVKPPLVNPRYPVRYASVINIIPKLNELGSGDYTSGEDLDCLVTRTRGVLSASPLGPALLVLGEARAASQGLLVLEPQQTLLLLLRVLLHLSTILASL